MSGAENAVEEAKNWVSRSGAVSQKITAVYCLIHQNIALVTTDITCDLMKVRKYHNLIT